MKKTSHFIFIILPFLWLFTITKACSKSRIEDFYFLNQTFEEAKFVTSGEDLLQSYSVFVLSTWLSFETKYWALELLRKSLNPDSQLNTHSPKIVEIASVWTASSVALNSKYQQWPCNKILQYYLYAGGSLAAVLSGSLHVEDITVPASIFIFMSTVSLAKTLSGTVTTSSLRKKNNNTVEISPDLYDAAESVVLSLGFGLSTGLAVFSVLTLYQVSSVKSVVCTSITTLSVMAVAELSHYIVEPDASLTGILKTLAPAATTAGALAGLGVLLETCVGTEVGAKAIAEFGAVTGIMTGAGANAITVAVAMARAVDRVEVVAGAGVGVVVSAILATIVGVGASLILVRPNPVYHTRYNILPTIGVASIFAFANAIANYLNTGAPLDQTLSEISWSYWDWGDWLIHKAPDYLWTAPDSQ